MSFFFSSRRRHTRCALVTGVQTCALPISGAVRVTRNILQKEGWPFRMDDQQSSIEFDPKAICALRNPDQEVCVAYFVAEEDETGQSVLEIGRALCRDRVCQTV